MIFQVDGVRVKAYLAETSFLLETVEEIKLAINNLQNFNIDLGHNIVDSSRSR